jgi:O-antigen ligase
VRVEPLYSFFLLSGITDLKERLRFNLVLLFVISLPYDLVYSSVIFGTLAAATIFDINREKLRSIPRNFWMFQVLYFPAVAGYFYSYHKGDASFLLERQLSILLMPVILPLAIQINETAVRSVLRALTATSVIVITYLFAHMVYSVFFLLRLPFNAAFSGAFFTHGFSRPVGIHAGYLSLYVSLSMLYVIYSFLKADSSRIKLLLVASLLILLTGLFFLAARNNILATLFVLVVIFPLYSIRNKKKYILTTLSFLVCGLILINNINYLKERFSVGLISEIRPVNGKLYYNFVEPRVERWKGAVELIKASPVIGYGTGDEIAMLRYQYIKRHLFISYLESFNAHNQYLSFLIKHGVLGFLVLVAAFAFYVTVAIRSRSYIYLAFLCLLLIGFYTENILDANKGILFFSFFNTMLGYSAGRSVKIGDVSGQVEVTGSSDLAGPESV